MNPTTDLAYSPALISLSHIFMKRANRDILADVSLGVRRGDFLAVTGPNGGGKTTLLRIMLRLLKPTSGSVTYADPALRIGYLPQKSAVDASFPITVRQVIASGLGGHMAPGISDADRRARVEAMLDRCELRSHADSPIGALSGGQLQRTLLGRALVADPLLLVLDEPLSYLDRHFEQRLYDELRALDRNTSVVLVSHEMSQISGMATRHIIIDHTLTECHSSSHSVHFDCQPL